MALERKAAEGAENKQGLMGRQPEPVPENRKAAGRIGGTA